MEGHILDSLQELKKKLISQKFKEVNQISLDSLINKILKFIVKHIIMFHVILYELPL